VNGIFLASFSLLCWLLVYSPFEENVTCPSVWSLGCTPEFKLEALQLLKSSGKTKAALERELGLYDGQLSLWQKALNKEGGNVEQAFPGTGHQSDTEAEVSRLKRELEIVRQERDILKKAIAIFSKTQDQE
jgi:transposase